MPCLKWKENRKKHREEDLVNLQKHCKMTCPKWKANKKEHTQEDLFNLLCDNVYLPISSFCRFHKTFGLN